MSRAATIAAALAAAALAMAPALAQRAARMHVDLAPADHGELARIELMQGSAADPGRARRPVSDLLLRVRSPAGDAMGALKAPDGFGPGGRQPLLVIDVTLVAAGRIVLDERVACQRWVADVAVCQAECDGGQFALERSENGAVIATFGRLPKDLAEHLEPGYRLGACSGSAAHSLVPVRATSASITLTPR